MIGLKSLGRSVALCCLAVGCAADDQFERSADENSSMENISAVVCRSTENTIKRDLGCGARPNPHMDRLRPGRLATLEATGFFQTPEAQAQGLSTRSPITDVCAFVETLENLCLQNGDFSGGGIFGQQLMMMNLAVAEGVREEERKKTLGETLTLNPLAAKDNTYELLDNFFINSDALVPAPYLNTTPLLFWKKAALPPIVYSVFLAQKNKEVGRGEDKDKSGQVGLYTRNKSGEKCQEISVFEFLGDCATTFSLVAREVFTAFKGGAIAAHDMHKISMAGEHAIYILEGVEGMPASVEQELWLKVRNDWGPDKKGFQGQVDFRSHSTAGTCNEAELNKPSLKHLSGRMREAVNRFLVRMAEFGCKARSRNMP